jgi:hypothetical protein
MKMNTICNVLAVLLAFCTPSASVIAQFTHNLGGCPAVEATDSSKILSESFFFSQRMLAHDYRSLVFLCDSVIEIDGVTVASTEISDSVKSMFTYANADIDQLIIEYNTKPTTFFPDYSIIEYSFITPPKSNAVVGDTATLNLVISVDRSCSPISLVLGLRKVRHTASLPSFDWVI